MTDAPFTETHWHPIETAPKSLDDDCRTMIVWNGDIALALYSEWDFTPSQLKSCRAGTPAKFAGWTDAFSGDPCDPQPTHWMPIPAGPRDALRGDAMTDAPFTETHRITLDVMAASNDTLPHESAAITAALREIEYQTNEAARLLGSLHIVREDKDQRIVELIQQLTVQTARAQEAEARVEFLMQQHGEVIVEAAKRLALRQEEIDRLAALVQNLRTQLGNLHNILKAEQA